MSAALSRRADIKLARMLVRAAGEDQRIIAAAYYPALDATFSGTYIPVTISTSNAGSARSSDNIISSEVTGGVAYTWRVVDNGKVGGQVARARAIREMNEISLRQLEANVSLELKRIQNNLHAIDRTLEIIERGGRQRRAERDVWCSEVWRRGFRRNWNFAPRRAAFSKPKALSCRRRISKMWPAPNGIARPAVTFNFPRTLRETCISCSS